MAIREYVHFVLICHSWVHPSQLLKLNQSNVNQNEVNKSNRFDYTDTMWNVKKWAITQHRDENNNNHKWKTYINKDWVNIQIDGNRNPSIVDWVNDSGWHELKTY